MPSSSSSASGAGHDVSPPRPTGQEVALFDPEEAARWEEQQARDQAELTMIKAVIGSVFSLKKPRDVVAGTSSGLATVAKGVGLGLASLVAQPYIGAKTGGAKGFVKGVGGGVLTCVGSTVAGAVVGTTQIVRGVVNTPNAIVQKARGQVWNPERRKWEEDWYSLAEEEIEVFGPGGVDAAGKSGEGADTGAAASSSGAGSRRPRREVVDRTLYDLLNAEPEATEAELRRAFYKKSLALHPDKNPDNPEATREFQAVSDAYRILGDPDRRRAYDEQGQDSAAAGLPKIEPVVFFAALFGSHHFEPFIGRLRLAQNIDGDIESLLRDVFAGGEDEPPAIDMLKVHRAQKRMQTSERERQVRLALGLAKRLAPVVGVPDADLPKARETWEAQQRTDIAQLAQAPCGSEMLCVIGWVYANRARQFIAGGMLRRVLAKVEGDIHVTQSKAKLAGSVGRTCVTAVNGIMKTNEKKKKKEKQSLSSKAAKAEEASTDAQAPEDDVTSQAPEPTPGQSDQPQSTPLLHPDSAGAAGGASGSGRPASNEASSGHARPGDGVGGSDTSAAAWLNSDTRSNSTCGTAAASAATEDRVREGLTGTVVIIKNLVSASELNNEVGMVCGYDPESDRYLVQIPPDVGMKKLKRENFDVLQLPEGDFENDATSGGTSPPGGPSGETGAEDPGYGHGIPSGNDDADMADVFKDCMTVGHDAFWNVTALDIEFTLARVIQKVLRDMSVDKSVRRQRATALLQLGRMLQEPLKEKKQKMKATADATPTSPAGAPGAAEPAAGASGEASGHKKSMLTRLKPKAWRGSGNERKARKARLDDMKQKRMEAALAMMAAGASTEDVDEMAAARATLEAEMEADGYNFAG